jgi:hypothetical protein
MNAIAPCNLALVGRNLAQAIVGRDSVRRIRGLLHRDRDESQVKIPDRAEALFLNRSRCGRLGATLPMAYNGRGIYLVARFRTEHSL